MGGLLLVLLFTFVAQVRADNGDVVTPDGDNGANSGQVVATSTDGTGGQHGVGGTIITGDATATTTVENEVNKNNVDPDVVNDSGCTAEDDDSETSQYVKWGGMGTSSQCMDGVDNDSDGYEDFGDSTTNASTWTATSTNDALVGTFATSTASTGANVAEGGQGLATIVTGNAMAFANVINLINTNIFNSIGLIKFVNQMFGSGLDLRDYDLGYFFDGEAGASPTVNEQTGEPQCTLLTCLNSSKLNVLSGNTATVTNSVIVRADAGGNTATTSGDSSTLSEESECGDLTSGACIKTGNAYAGANVLNLVNTNIVNSSYLMVSFNNFGDLEGDVTLPSQKFFDDLFARGGSAPAMNSSKYEVYNDNIGTSTGSTAVNANTGSSTATATGEGSGIVATGDAYSQSTEFTSLNSNYVGGSSVFFMFRVAGEWLGSVKSLPNGLNFKRIFDAATKDGVTSTSTLVLITNEETDQDHVPLDDPEGLQDPEGTPAANCDEDEGPINNCFNSSGFLASSTNAAFVQNDIDVEANTGRNVAVTEDGTAHVVTGDAYAIANVINMINTNIVGRNWIFALFNVLGNWDGDVTFGKSALALEATTAQAPVTPGSTVDYTFTITNNGDRDADDIVLKADYDKDQLSFNDEEGVVTPTGREWRVPTVRRGGSKTYTYQARVGAIVPGTAQTVPMTVSALSDGNGAEAQASFTLATLDVVSPGPTGGGNPTGGGKKTTKVKAAKNSPVVAPTSSKNPDITVDNQVVAIGTTTPATVDYKVVVTNQKKAGALYDGKLTVTFFDPEGGVMNQRYWDIGAMAAGEQIILAETMQFPTTTMAGAYRNVAEITGQRLGSGREGKAFEPIVGVVPITLQGGAVLGAATDCSLAVNQTLSYGMTNPEVIKLQAFLNAHQGSGLPATGFFGPMTRAAVSTFQKTYAADILAPLGLTFPTGSVAGMTQKKIRAIACGSTAAATQ